jgi:hypothetical protein
LDSGFPASAIAGSDAVRRLVDSILGDVRLIAIEVSAGNGTTDTTYMDWTYTREDLREMCA